MAQSLKLLKYYLEAPIERIRGGNICVQISAEFVDYTPVAEWHALDTIIVPGVAIVQEEKDVQEGIKQALANAWENAHKLMEEEPQPLLVGNHAPEVLKSMLDHTVKAIESRASHTQLEELNQPASAALQKRVTDICQILGIDTISVEGTWSSIEVAALLQELNRASTKITKVAE